MKLMSTINDRLEDLSKKSKQIILYTSDVKTIMKGIGRIPGKFDSELLEFLKFTNGASIFDYCFMGFKNNKLGVDVDKFVRELWSSNNMLAGSFLPFMGTSTSDNFGYLIGHNDNQGRHPIAYYSDNDSQHIYVIASSFNRFMNTFLNDVENTLENSRGDLILGIDKTDWPTNIEHWLLNDDELVKLRGDGTFQNYMGENFPNMSWL